LTIREPFQRRHHGADSRTTQTLLRRPQSVPHVRRLNYDQAVRMQPHVHASRWIKVAAHIEQDHRSMNSRVRPRGRISVKWNGRITVE
jgi:hypothetical protein